MGKLKTLALPIGISVVVVAIVTVLVMTFAGKDEDVYRVIKVNRFEGTVTIDRDEKMSAFEGLRLVSEDSVTVGPGSFLELLADSDKHIGAEENTVFTIQFEGTETNGGITINLLYGRQLFKIDNKLSETSYFEVTTPNATMSVCGTEFWVEYIPEKETTIVEVIEGVVEVDYYGVKEFLKPGDKRVIYPEYAGNSDAGNSLGTITTTVSEETTTTTTEETTVSETTVTGEDAPAVTTAPYEMVIPEATTVPVDMTLPEETTTVTTIPEKTATVTTVPERTTEVTTVPEETTEVTTVPGETTVPEETTTSSGTSSPTATTTAVPVVPEESTTTETTVPASGYTTYIIGTYDIDRNATQYDLDENGRPTIIRLYDTDGNLVYYNKYEYNNDGTATVKLLQADQTLDAEYLLDEDGNVIKTTTYIDGKIRDCSEYVYDDGSEDPRRTKYTSYSYVDGVLRNYYEMYYNEDGKMTKEIAYDADDNPTHYNYYDYYADGSLKSDSRHNADNELYEYVEYYEGGEQYQEKMKKKITYSDDASRIETEYDENGNMTVYLKYNADDEITAHLVYEYDANGKKTKLTQYYYNDDGTVNYYAVTTYDSDGNATSLTNYNADGTVKE